MSMSICSIMLQMYVAMSKHFVVHNYYYKDYITLKNSFSEEGASQLGPTLYDRVSL